MTTGRFIALLGPYIALLSGTIAAWLSTNFPGLADDVPAETQSITQAITFAVGALVTWALQHKYLDGLQKWEQAEAARLGHHGRAEGGAGVAATGAASAGNAEVVTAGAGAAIPVAMGAAVAPAGGAGAAAAPGVVGGAGVVAAPSGEPFGGFDPAIFDGLVGPAPALGNGKAGDG